VLRRSILHPRLLGRLAGSTAIGGNALHARISRAYFHALDTPQRNIILDTSDARRKSRNGEHTSEIDSHPVSPGPNFSGAAATRRVLARSLRAAIDGLDLTRDASDSARVDWWYLSKLRLIYKPCLICDAIYKESSHPSRCRPPLVRLLPVPDLPCSFAAVCASPYDRSAVRPTRFSSHPPRMDIHSTPHTVFSAFLSPSLSSLSNTRTRAHTRALLFPRCVSPPFDPVSLRRSLYALAIRIFQSAVHA